MPTARWIPAFATSLLLSGTLAAQTVHVPRPVDSPDGDAAVEMVPLESMQTSSTPTPTGTASSNPIQLPGPRPPIFVGPCGKFDAYFLSNGFGVEGDTPSAVAFLPDGSQFLVAHRDSQNLIVYDASTQAFVREIQLSGGPVAVAITSDGQTAVTANLFEDTASIVDLTTGTETDVVTVGDQPGVVRITPSGSTAVVGNLVDQTLSVIDIGTATVTRVIAGAGFVNSTTIAFEPGAITTRSSQLEIIDETTAIAPDYWNDQVDFFNLATGAVNTIAINDQPRGLAITPDRSTAVIAHTFSARRLTVIDTATQTVSKVIATGIDLWGPVCLSPSGGQAVCAVQNACVVIDLVTNAVSSTLNTASVNDLITTADGQYALAVGFSGSLISFATQTVVKQLNNVVSVSNGAVSPIEPRAVMTADSFGEDMLVVNTNGALGFLENQTMSGPIPEADKNRMVAVSADGTRAVTTNVLSDSATIFDLTTGQVLFVSEVGNRPADVEITPDGSKAVVANLDSTFASIIDMATGAVTNVNISTRGSEVEISPDGQYAYVAVVVSDGVWRIDLTTNTVAGPRLNAGQMGSIGFNFSQASGLSLSPDGSTLVACNSFDDTLTIIDTASWSVAQTVAVGDFPVRAAFNATSDRMYVSNRNADTISELQKAATWSVTNTIAVGDQPFEMVVSQDGSALWVANYLDENIGVVDLITGTMVQTIPLPYNAQGLNLTSGDSCLWAISGGWSVALGPGNKISITLEGAITLIDTQKSQVSYQIETPSAPAMLGFDATGSVGAMAAPMTEQLYLVRQR
ncbi:MAG: YncE family protein [Planctomycetota bacterium]